MVPLLSALPLTLGKTSPVASAKSRASSRISTERSHSGTRWGLEALARSAGISHVAVSQSISAQEVEFRAREDRR